ncbi:MAG: transketolase [Thermovirgaceae bacterium]
MKTLKAALEGFPEGTLKPGLAEKVREAARLCRINAVTMTAVAGSGHPAGSLSSMEMCLLTYGVAKIGDETKTAEDMDKVVVSHGHISPAVYSVLACYGFLPEEDVLAFFRKAGSPYQGHVVRQLPGVFWSTGNLGQGLAAGAGFALAKKARKEKGRVYVLMGDGEQVKGQVAEARRIARHHGLSNLTVLVDVNHIQISGRTENIMAADIKKLWEADGWDVGEVDGHDPVALYGALYDACLSKAPKVLLCRTVMGKGVSFMEGLPDYHGKAPKDEEYEIAMKELGGNLGLLGKYRKKRAESPLPASIFPTKAPEVRLDGGTPRDYDAGQLTDCRSAFGKALADVGEANYGKKGKGPLLVFDCDLAGSVKVSEYAKKCPEWFFETGIQEHATATVAGAASISGCTSLWADFGVFGLAEVYNQQRLNDINGTNLKLALTHVGLDVGEDGETHQCIDYIGLLKNFFEWKLLVPADPNQADRMTRYILTTPGNICIVMGRSKVPVLTTEEGKPLFAGNYRFRYGKADLLRNGGDLAIMTSGHMAYRAVTAWEKLREEGISAKIYHIGCPLAIDDEALMDAAATGRIITYEDHNKASGLGCQVGSALAERGVPARLLRMGVHRYGDSGKSSEVIERMGLSADDLVRAAVKLLQE